jgi:DNA-binding transcriptional regulator YiaG
MFGKQHLVGVSRQAMAFWELGKSRPQGRNRAALIALRGLGRREVKRILGEKK